MAGSEISGLRKGNATTPVAMVAGLRWMICAITFVVPALASAEEVSSLSQSETLQRRQGEERVSQAPARRAMQTGNSSRHELVRKAPAPWLTLRMDSAQATGYRIPGMPMGFWIASAGAGAGLGVGATFTLLGAREKASLSHCSPHCADGGRDMHARIKRDYLIADVGFAASAATAGVATWIWVWSRATSQDSQLRVSNAGHGASRLIPSCWVTQHSATLSWSGFF